MSVGMQMKMHADVAALLEKLGHMSCLEIVELFRREKVTGVPRVGAICGLARYLNRMTGANVCVTSREVAIFTGPGMVPTHIDLPLSCREFVSGFDRDQWPDLRMHRPVELRLFRPGGQWLSVSAELVSVVGGPSQRVPIQWLASSDQGTRELVGSVA